MGHNIYREQFYSLRQPAWHNLGFVSQMEEDAITVSERLQIPQIYTAPIQTVDGLVIPGHKAIIGKVGDEETPFSVVSDGYQEMTHFDFIRAWDQSTKHTPVETMGLLGKGDTLFITTKLPGFDIKGVEHANYLMAYNPLTGKNSACMRQTPTRVVCQNTLNASVATAVREYKCHHLSKQASQMHTWISETWDTMQTMTQIMVESLTVLADVRITDFQSKVALEQVYSDQERPVDANPTMMAQWEKYNASQSRHRDAIFGLFDGEGSGSEYDDVKGTAYGLFNSVVEYEQHGRKFSRAQSFMFGAGERRVQKAFDVSLALVGR